MGRSKVKTQEAKESYLVSLALDEVEKRLKNGTATSQIISQLLSLATTKYRLQAEKLRSDIELQSAKRAEIEEKSNMTELFEKAMAAFTTYSGNRSEEEYYEDDE